MIMRLLESLCNTALFIKRGANPVEGCLEVEIR